MMRPVARPPLKSAEYRSDNSGPPRAGVPGRTMGTVIWPGSETPKTVRLRRELALVKPIPQKARAGDQTIQARPGIARD